MRICVVGAGAIGGLLAARLAKAGHTLTVIARGAHLAAIRDRGLRIVDDSEDFVVHCSATDQLSAAGEQDLVILAVKAHQVAAIAPDLAATYHDTTMVLTAQNGIPWWYFMKQPGPHQGLRLESVDPGGLVADHIDVERVIGSVVYPAAEVVSPGVIHHLEGNRFSIGELDNSDSERIRSVSEVLRGAGFKAPVLSDIRSEIWTKLWGNLSLNPISALSHATLVDICQFPASRDLLAKMMAEAQQVAEALDIRFKVSLEKRIAGAEAVGKHKTSMLQDLEAGRPMEIDALVGSIVELGRVTQIATPHIDAIFATISLLAKTLEEQHGRLRIESEPSISTPAAAALAAPIAAPAPAPHATPTA
jgi:2-dehydropantoate 2-reductase